MRLGRREKSRPSLGGGERRLRGQFGEQEARKRERFAHAALEAFFPVLADEAVRILAVGEEQERDGLVILRQRQADLERTPRRLADSSIGIEAEYHLVC